MLIENIDFYINADGNFVFTREYHLKRGSCCKNKCLHCPWEFGREKQIKDVGIGPMQIERDGDKS